MARGYWRATRTCWWSTQPPFTCHESARGLCGRSHGRCRSMGRFRDYPLTQEGRRAIPDHALGSARLMVGLVVGGAAGEVVAAPRKRARTIRDADAPGPAIGVG